MHVSMSHWEAPEITNNMYETIRKRFMPMIKSLGATQCFEVQTSDTTVSIIAVYPDEVTFIEASQRIAEIRSEGSDTFGATLIKAEAGPMAASVGI